MKKIALLSVYDKAGIVEFANELIELGWTIISSGGTAKTLKKAQLDVTDVAEFTGREAVLDHRVVTLAPEIHGGLLAAEKHLQELKQLGYPWIDLVCVDLYPLKDEVRNPDATRESVIEKTDVGGPTMIRSGAKGRRIVIADPADRPLVIEWLREGQMDDAEVRNTLAAKAEAIVADYCLESARYHSGGEIEGLVGQQVQKCSYGENAWQTPAGLYTTNSGDPLALDQLRLIEGKPMSYNNAIDVERLQQTATHIAAALKNFDGREPFLAVGVKHGNPCGAAIGTNREQVLGDMMLGNKRAIFGGLVLTNFVIDAAICEPLSATPLDGIVAPGFAPEAIACLKRKEGRCRFLKNPALQNLAGQLDQSVRIRPVRGGFMVQPNYEFVLDLSNRMVLRYGVATLEQERDMLLAWAIGSTSNSNTITLVKHNQLIGNGVGQQDRVGAAELAVKRAVDADHDVRGAVAYSDSFFPVDDGPKALIEAGVSAIITTSGSVRDQDTIRACEAGQVALYMVPDKLARGFFNH